MNKIYGYRIKESCKDFDNVCVETNHFSKQWSFQFKPLNLKGLYDYIEEKLFTNEEYKKELLLQKKNKNIVTKKVEKKVKKTNSTNKKEDDDSKKGDKE
jgi:hypothetical protein